MIGLITLGAARVHRGDLAFPDLPAQRLRFALLVYLATERDVAREDVVAMFWPDRDTARGRHALRQMLYELRGVLGEDWVELRRDRIVCTAHLDATAFERAADEGRIAEALALYGGPFLSGFAFDHAAFEGWADRKRAHLARLHRKLQREHIAALTAAGGTDEAVTAARRWVELDPLDDEAAHTLIERLFHAGQRTAALQYFESYQRQLAAELQVDPIDPTLELVAQIRSGAAQPSAPLPAARPARRSTDTGDGLHATSAPTTSTRDLLARFPRVSARFAAAAIIVFLVASLGTGLFARFPSAATAELPRTLRVAVSSLEVSEDSLANIATELAEQLTAALGQSSMLEVVSSRSISLRQEGGAPTVDSIGRLLGADYVVGGSIVPDPDAIRLNVELFDGRDGRIVRTETLRRPAAEAPTLVREAVGRLATMVREELGAQLEIQRYRAVTDNPRAWQLVLDGKAVLANVDVYFGSNELDAAVREIRRADTLFAAAERADRRWATPVEQRARARRWQAYVMQMQRSPERRRVLEEGLAFANRAIVLDDDNAGAHEIRGVLLNDFRLGTDGDSAMSLRSEALASFKRATELEPGRQLAQFYLAQIHAEDGRFAEAIVAAGNGYRSDPWSQLASALIYIQFAANFEAGFDREAESWCLDGRMKFPDQGPFVMCLFQLHGWGSLEPQPLRLRQELGRIPPRIVNTQPYLRHYFEGQVAAAFARAGQADSARAILARLPTMPPPHDALVRAAAYVQLGDFDTAVTLLRAYLDLPDASPAVLNKRQFSRLRGQPAFEALLGGS